MNGTCATYWRGLAAGRRGSLLDRLLLILLEPTAVVYSLVQRLRAALYGSGYLETRHLPLPVVSIGNITVGGTGKTPVAAYIARRLMDRGYRVALLSRGYGGSLEGSTALVCDGREILLSAEECGDEPYLLARTVPGLIVAIGSDRYAAGLLAIKECPPDVFLLDDGFQHLRLHRDLNILLLDAVRPFGNGWTLPAGLMREPRHSVRRADLVVLTRCPEGGVTVSPVPETACCRSRHNIADLVPLTGGHPLSFDMLQGSRIVAFSGIAEPQSFFDGLGRQGLAVSGSISFPDHVVYNADRLAEVEALMRVSGADYAITTEKDGVKLTSLPQSLAGKVLLARLVLTMDDAATLDGFLCNLL